MTRTGIIVSPHHQNQTRLMSDLKNHSDHLHYLIGRFHGRRIFIFRERFNEELVIVWERNDKFYDAITGVEKVQDFFNNLEDKIILFG